ncbi:hypothetical protein AtNW77_Chr3g0186251 [Arabidopsis thaliana]|uniref:Uncharacterized protein n=2 Tax=Arabidopsis TaxID=3701 RepID=F4JCH0_ARATH|nr:uncharacterized protein AT3G26235 [Arabidopsis thaliana]AEE77137.1 hypothetical protein AT3G26235 [Arabidopsis thaliana]KAG7626637.1 hypothetical protein ISN45_At03g027760 [Arabidopsis thaliana x Arabidopsis arenosa]|eukprot:NP_683595.1 hypothetical protein AT3G26235 [Arabidopsis thaliana]
MVTYTRLLNIKTILLADQSDITPTDGLSELPAEELTDGLAKGLADGLPEGLVDGLAEGLADRPFLQPSNSNHQLIAGLKYKRQYGYFMKNHRATYSHYKDGSSDARVEASKSLKTRSLSFKEEIFSIEDTYHNRTRGNHTMIPATSIEAANILKTSKPPFQLEDSSHEIISPSPRHIPLLSISGTNASPPLIPNG